MGKKSRAKNKNKHQQDESQVYMKRLQANLEFFRKNRPQVYEMLSNMRLERAEFVVTPGKSDVDMVFDGRSCYRGLAKEYSVGESEKVLTENPESKRMLTFAPPSIDQYPPHNDVFWRLSEIIAASPVEGKPFEGYIRGNFFPSIVFLGCGLGYQIEALVEKVEIINAIIVEREPEKFVLSLYAVDWASICSKFARKGRSISFAIGKADSEEQVRSLVFRHMTKDVPFFPFFTTYYNHLADIELAKGVIAASKDLSVITTNWSNYDNELLRLSNSRYNMRNGLRFLDASSCPVIQDLPLVVVGSGPSLDGRLDSLKKVRDKVVIVSAGTGLAPLLAVGIEPDFHVELDPSHLIYRLLADLPDQQRRRIPLVACNEVNPHVPGLFDRTYYFFKSDNFLSSLVGTQGNSFSGCNPTVTNTALAIGNALGFSSVYLFGTDYGFIDEENDHSRLSVYGAESSVSSLERFRDLVREKNRSRRLFDVPSVNGGTVKTAADYYSAKRSVENLLADLKSFDSRLSVRNCSDGAVIEGTKWVSPDAFLASMESEEGVQWDASASFDACSGYLEWKAMESKLEPVRREVDRACRDCIKILKGARLDGRKDLCRLVNELRQEAIIERPRVGAPGIGTEQAYRNQLMKGTLLHFLYVGLTHGMACEERDVVSFAAKWRKNFVSALEGMPDHFVSVMIENAATVEDDPWAFRDMVWEDPAFKNSNSDGEC